MVGDSDNNIMLRRQICQSECGDSNSDDDNDNNRQDEEFDRKDPCSVYAAPMTLEHACTCPHLEALLPTTSLLCKKNNSINDDKAIFLSQSHLSNLGGKFQHPLPNNNNNNIGDDYDMEKYLPYWKRSEDSKSQTDDQNSNNQLSQSNNISPLVEEYFATLKQVRMEYYANAGGDGKNRCTVCTHCPVNNRVLQFGENGDHILQCLSCSYRGCGPICTSFSFQRQHLMQHFVKSGHNFAVSCGPASRLYCFTCGDYVYHPLWQNRVERMDIQQQQQQQSTGSLNIIQDMNIPISRQRSFSAYEYYIIPIEEENHTESHKRRKVVWRGLIASYVQPMPKTLYAAYQMAYKRYLIFHYFSSSRPQQSQFAQNNNNNNNSNTKQICLLSGNTDYYYLRWGPKAMKLALHLWKHVHRHTNNNNESSDSTERKQMPWILAPVGIYNLGNTCFMSAVLQCLIHCPPLQHSFLTQVSHHFHSNQIVSSSSTIKTKFCLASEMDKFFLQYLGSTIGLDNNHNERENEKAEILQALKEPDDPSYSNIQNKIQSSKNNYDHHSHAKNGKKKKSKKSKKSKHTNTFHETNDSSHPANGNTDDDNKNYPVSDNMSSDVNNNANTTDTKETNHRKGSFTVNSNPDCTAVNDSKRGMPLVPSNLLTTIWNCPDTEHMAGYEQRDAHEFLQVFLDNLSKHFQTSHAKFQRLMERSSPSPNSSQKYKDPIQQIFGGTLRSVLMCKNCGCKRSQLEPFLNISLPLSKELAAAEAYKKNSTYKTMGTRKSNSRLSVELCLEHFTIPEELADPVHCPSCNEKTPTLKQHTFAKLPNILCLHLKRFDSISNKKITDFVAFPSLGLNMGPHLPHWCEVVQGENNTKSIRSTTSTSMTISPSSDEQKKHNVETCPKILYDLFGSIVHTGSLHQGHYMADVKVTDQWYHCNDTFIKKVEGGENEVLKREGAYILFYSRR